jgi:hypothetical protein
VIPKDFLQFTLSASLSYLAARGDVRQSHRDGTIHEASPDNFLMTRGGGGAGQGIE